MGMLLIGAVVGCICGGIGYKFNTAAGAVIGIAAAVIGAIGYDQIPSLVDSTWGAGSCPVADQFIDPARHAECVIDASERVVAGFWFLVGGAVGAGVTYGVLERVHGEREL